MKVVAPVVRLGDGAGRCPSPDGVALRNGDGDSRRRQDDPVPTKAGYVNAMRRASRVCAEARARYPPPPAGHDAIQVDG
jgi:hypothetical protein